MLTLQSMQEALEILQPVVERYAPWISQDDRITTTPQLSERLRVSHFPYYYLPQCSLSTQVILTVVVPIMTEGIEGRLRLQTVITSIQSRIDRGFEDSEAVDASTKASSDHSVLTRVCVDSIPAEHRD